MQSGQDTPACIDYDDGARLRQLRKPVAVDGFRFTVQLLRNRLSDVALAKAGQRVVPVLFFAESQHLTQLDNSLIVSFDLNK